MTVLVTGATGNLGVNLVRRLVADGADVAILKPHGEPLRELAGLRGALDVRFGDVRDLDAVRRAMRGISRVYHLAGITVPLDRLAGLMWEVNVVGAHHVALAALESGVERLVHTSSTAAIGYPPDGVVAGEDFDAADSTTTTAYAVTKRRGEELVRGIGRAGLDVVVVNPAAVLGPGGDPRFGWGGLVERVARGQLPCYPSGGTAVCTMTDLVAGQLAAMARGVAGERYILSTANLSYRELVATVAEVVGVPAVRRRAPDWLLGAAGRAGSAVGALRRDPLASPLLVTENARLLTRTLFYDPAKARRDLGLPRSPVPDAVRDVHRWLDARSADAIHAA